MCQHVVLLPASWVLAAWTVALSLGIAALVRLAFARGSEARRPLRALAPACAVGVSTLLLAQTGWGWRYASCGTGVGLSLAWAVLIIVGVAGSIAAGSRNRRISTTGLRALGLTAAAGALLTALL